MNTGSVGDGRRPSDRVVLSPGVQPTWLCSACRPIFRGDPARFEKEDDSSLDSIVNVFPHHDTAAALRDAAADGCYICSRVVARLREESQSYDDDSNWEIPATTYEFDLVGPMIDEEREADLRIFAKLSGQKSHPADFWLFSSNDYAISQQLSPKVGSLQSLGKARSWIEACHRSVETSVESSGDLSTSANTKEPGKMHGHLSCRLYSTPGYVPKRLLDLGRITAGRWKVCVPFEDDTDVKAYTTLSYCWGDSHFLKLTKQLLPSFRTGKSISQLPRLFRDAMTVTKNLGFQYIWIDALCIVQDSEEDFNNQVAEMGDIYSNTAVNIIAAACRNPLESLFRARDSDSLHIGRFWPAWDTSDDLFAPLRPVDSIMEWNSLRREFENASTSRRGWILQERVISPRQIYFFRNQLYYRCRSSESCEIFPIVVPDRLKGCSEVYDLPSPNQERSPFVVWKFLAEEYSRCSFRHPGDKIIALSGLVQIFKIATKDEYVAGLWKSQLPSTLGWHGYNGSPRRRSSLNIAPTWSWLSIDGKIDMDDTGLGCKHKTVICDILEVSKAEVHTNSIEEGTLDVLTIWTLSIPAWIAVDGSLATSSFSEDLAQHADFSVDDTYEILAAGTRLVIAILKVDGCCKKCLGFNRHHPMEGSTRWEITALVLQQAEGSGYYRRIGRLRIEAKEPHARVQDSELLERFSLKIKNSFGDVIVTDASGWNTLRII